MKTVTCSRTSIKDEVLHLRREISTLRSFMIGMAGKDHEGNYRAEAVQEIFEASLEPRTHRYSGKGSLLKQLKKV